MGRVRSRILGAALAAGLASASAASPSAGPLGGLLASYDAADPHAPPVEAGSLLESDRFWPYRTGLTRTWSPEPAVPGLPAGAIGVLVRVEPGGLARIDFGRDGIHRVPVEATDLVARAERVRRGEHPKVAPNLVHAVGPRLGDAAAEEPAPFRFERAGAVRRVLSVYADPSAPGFEVLARELAPLRDRAGLLTVLFPQGSHPDLAVRARLRELGWPVPFVLDHMAEAYTRSQLDAEATLPAVQLQTPDGRLLFSAAWRPGIAGSLAGALEAPPGDTGARAAGAAAPAPARAGVAGR